MEEKNKSKEEILEKHKLLKTPQRLAVLEFIEQFEGHPTGEQIYDFLKSRSKVFSKATVYNTLKVLTKLGVIQVLHINSVQKYYDKNPHPHAHFYCLNCCKIFDVNFPLENLKIEKIEGNKVYSLNLTFYGICKNCQQENSSTNFNNNPA